MVNWFKRRVALWALGHVGFTPYSEVCGCSIELVVERNRVWINANGHCVFRGSAVPECAVKYNGVTLEHWVFNGKDSSAVNRNRGLF